MLSRFSKKSLLNAPGWSVNTPCSAPSALAFSARIPPTSTVISGTVSVCIFCSLLDGCSSTQNDQVGERYLLVPRLRTIEGLLNALQLLQYFRQFFGVVGIPIFLRGEAHACAIGTTAHVGTAERSRGSPCCADELRSRQSGIKNVGLERCNICIVNQLMIHRRDRILPKQRFFGNTSADVARTGTHVAMCQLEPRFRKCQLEFFRVFLEAFRDFAVAGIELQ